MQLRVLSSHEHVHSFLRGYHVRGPLGADDRRQSVGVVSGVQGRAGEVVAGRRRALRVRLVGDLRA